jgi:sterol desaturase/sphingolipid hydroxylase (fatty acid hydroxylase superfamily)
MLILIGVFLAGLVIFHCLERFAPVKEGYRPVTRRGFLADITAALVDGPVLSALTRIGAFYVIMQFPQYTDGMARWNWWVQFAVFFIVNDFARYWLHRWHHESDLLWRIHRVHHTAVEMDALSTFRVHLLEAARISAR